MSIVPGTENPQYPSGVSEIFAPDQLIAGRYPLITGEKVLLTGGAVLQRGTVLGQMTLPTATVTAKAGNVGNGTVTAVSLTEFAAIGTYSLVEVTPTTFAVTAPNGDALGTATAGAQFNNQISFLITAGGTAFAAADAFTITGEAGSGLFKLSVATASDGSQVPNAILADYTDPTSGNVYAAVYYAGEFNLNAVTFDPSWTSATLAPKLRANNIYLKNSVSAGAVTSNA
jgi:hypothetical protein